MARDKKLGRDPGLCEKLCLNQPTNKQPNKQKTIYDHKHAAKPSHLIALAAARATAMGHHKDLQAEVFITPGVHEKMEGNNFWCCFFLDIFGKIKQNTARREKNTFYIFPSFS